MIIGIDPGVSGALCFYKSRDEFELYKMPALYEINKLSEMFKIHGKGTVYIEKAQSMPQQGVKSMFNYGKHTGWVLGFIQAHRMPFVEVSPVVWTKKLHAGVTQYKGKGSGKLKSLEAVNKLYPEVNLLASERSKKPHDGFIDALLIAHFGYINENQG